MTLVSSPMTTAPRSPSHSMSSVSEHIDLFLALQQKLHYPFSPHFLVHTSLFLCSTAAVNVTRYPDKYQELEGVQETTKFTVSFTGRQSQGVGVRWFKNGIELFNSAQYTISTSFFEETRTGNTSILFPDMDRGDSGVYRVLVSTSFAEEEIPPSQRRDEESFQIEILGEYIVHTHNTHTQHTLLLTKINYSLNLCFLCVCMCSATT